MLEILKFTIPSLIVLLSVWIVMHKLFKNEEQKRLWELKRAAQKEISPTRLRAYERLALLLERTQPEALVMALSERLEEAGTSLAALGVQKMQQELLRSLRLEFDHNMSQQVYVSDEVWAKIIGARDQMGAFITTMATQLPPGGGAMEYATVLMTAPICAPGSFGGAERRSKRIAVKTAKTIGLFVLLAVLAACEPDKTCRQDVDVNATILLKGTFIDTAGVASSFTTWDSITVQGVGSDSVLYDNEKSVSKLLVPLRIDKNVTAYALTWRGKTDTLYMWHDNTQRFISMACGCVVYHTIESVAGRSVWMDSLKLVNSAVENIEQDNVQVYVTIVQEPESTEE